MDYTNPVPAGSPPRTLNAHTRRAPPVKRSYSLLQLCGAILLLGLMSGIWASPALAQDAPDDAVEVTDEAADDEAAGDEAAGDEAAGDEATGEDAAAGEGEEPAEETVEEAGDDLSGVVVEETESPWTPGLLTSLSALFIGGFSAVLGIWVDRDKTRPVAFAAIMSILITAAIGVGATQSYLDALGAIQQRQDLERMLSMVGEIAESSGDESLAALLRSEGGPEVVITPTEPTEEPTEDVQDTDAAPEGEPVEDAAGNH